MEQNNRGYDITSTANQRIKDDSRLSERRYRKKTGLTSIEGHDEFLLAREAGVTIHRVYICPDFLRTGEELLVSRIEEDGVRVLRVPPQVMERLAYRQNPDGWLAVVDAAPLALGDLPAPGASATYIVAEDMEKPGNLGAILRSADAAGADAVIVSQRRTDLYNPNVIRASKGTIFSVPVVETSNTELYDWLARHQVSVVIADPEGGNDLWNCDLDSRTAVILGAENEGISTFWRDRSDVKLTIPMTGSVNSLNVAQAGTLILYEIYRRKSV